MQRSIKATIVTIGDELLIGQVIDTNSAWIAQELNKIGIWVKRRVSVGDAWDEIWNTLDEESREADVILITGGLGPTADDITKPLLCKYFGGELKTDDKVLAHIQHLFENVYRRPFTERNRKQAEVPTVCTVIHNARGTAPGMWFEKNDTIFVSMPGVPHEMKGMMTDIILNKIAERFPGHIISHRTLLTAGIGESFLADHIQQWEEQLPSHIKLAYLPNYGMVRLRITGTGSDRGMLEAQLDEEFSKLKILVNEWLVTDEDRTMQQVVSSLLKERAQTLSTAESCTGGYIAHLLTREPGASNFFLGGVVSYANEVKENVLHVSNDTLQTSGAVSRQTVEQMVQGSLDLMKTDYALAVSGIMGPDGGTPEKPVGSVWVAVGKKGKIISQHFNFRFDRSRNIEMTAIQALNMLRKLVLENEN
jgi:nicotinamide-nucleotide amidase